MWTITAETAAEYLRTAGRASADEAVEVRELTGGVSNVVLLVTLPAHGERFVLKQARGQLRVQEEWLCPVERIWREVEVLRACGEQLRVAECGVRDGERDTVATLSRPGVPEVLWEDRENFCFAMTAAWPKAKTWKEVLLAGRITFAPYVAAACGRLLGRLHAGSWKNAALAEQLADRTYFDQLRLDPYYRHAAKRNPDRTSQLADLVNSVLAHRLCLVHGDFSPKNLLVWPGHVWLIDHEVGHFGDPAFDLGFFLTHLVAKAVRAREACRKYLHLTAIFWNEYRRHVATVASAEELAALKRRMMLNLAGCLLARVDGKSPLEYLTEEERRVIRQLGREWLIAPPDRLQA
jgi:5-methylthioribose kinase